jgi:cytoskeletal protein RodZ
VGEFGSKFRKAREKKALSLDDVSHVTKIGSRMLAAIEEENFDRLPGGVFNKGFIRTYAKHLGLNDDEAIAAYLALLRQSQIDALDAQIEAQTELKEIRERDRRPSQSRGTPAQKPGAIQSGKPTAGKPNKTGANQSAAKPQAPAQLDELPELQLPRAEDVRPRRRDFGNSGPEIPWRLIAVAAVVLILATVLWIRRPHRANAFAFTLNRPSPAQSAPAAAPASRNPSPTSPSTSQAPNSAQRTTSAPQPLLRSASALSTHPPALAPASAPSPANNNSASSNPVSVPPLQKSNLAPAPSEKSPSPLTLVIRATETSWISVLADSQPVIHETLIAPARTSVRADREIIVKVGNAAGVAFFWNGQDVPATGAEAEVKTYVFDSTGMRSASAPPLPAQ